MAKENEFNDELLEGQIPEWNDSTSNQEASDVKNESYLGYEDKSEIIENEPELKHEELAYKNEASQYLGTKLSHFQGKHENNPEASREFAKERKLSRIGDKIQDNVEIREGWMEFDKSLLGKRADFYPDDWEFRIRPATVEAIRNWSTIDDENMLSVDDVFNEIMKSCVSIRTSNGQIPWGNINSWDRFFFLLTVRDYTFVKGEAELKYNEECPECENDVEFKLNSQALDYEFPDDEVMKYYDKEYRQWYIDPAEFGVEYPESITLYLPTLDKDSIIKKYMINRIQNKKKVDEVFMRFLPWMTPKLSKDEKIAERKIRELENEYKMWDEEMFEFMDNVVKNITVMPAQNMKMICPTCGEEVTAQIRFPDGVRSLFSIPRKFKKFGKK